MAVAQMFVLCLATVVVEPFFQGFSIKKEFDVSLKPFVFKPISFIKETFSPFGRFGIRHGIQKREVGIIVPAPVTEHVLHAEPASSIGPFLTPAPAVKLENLFFSPESVTVTPLLAPKPSVSPSPSITIPENRPVTSFRPGTSLFLPPPVPVKPTPPPDVLINPVTSQRLISSPHMIYPNAFLTQNDVSAASFDQSLISRPVSAVASPRPFNFLFNTPATIPPSNLGNVNINPAVIKMSPIQASTPLVNTVPGAIPPVPPAFINEVFSQGVAGETAQLSGLLNTDIGRAELINNYLNSVNPQPVDKKSHVKDIPPLSNNSIVPETSSSSGFMRGTKVALYFGNIFVQLMSQFFTNARMTLNQLPELRLRE